MRKQAMRGAVLALSVLGVSIGAGCNSTTPESTAPTGFAVKRYVGTGATAGELDTSFGGGGGAVVTKIVPSEFEYALAVALQADGKIVATGHSILAGQGVVTLVRYNADGSLDAANFGTGGTVRTPIASVGAVGTAIAMQGTQILVAGTTFVPSAPDPAIGTAGIFLARYNADGTLDTSGFGAGQGFVSADIGPGTDSDVASLALQSDGKIVVAGATTDGNLVLRRYDSAGVLDAAFGAGGTATTPVGPAATNPAIALQSSGKILAAGGAGSFSNPPLDAVLVRYNTDGSLDLPFGGANTGMVFTDTIPASANFANALAVQPDDKIVVAGHANVRFDIDTSDFSVVRYTADGALDTGFGTGGAVLTDLGVFDNALSVALQTVAADLKIVVSGNASVGGIPRFAVVRYNSDGSLDGSFNASAGGGIVTTLASGPSTIASGNAVAIQSDGNIVVAGYD